MVSSGEWHAITFGMPHTETGARVLVVVAVVGAVMPLEVCQRCVGTAGVGSSADMVSRLCDCKEGRVQAKDQ